MVPGLAGIPPTHYLRLTPNWPATPKELKGDLATILETLRNYLPGRLEFFWICHVPDNNLHAHALLRTDTKVTIPEGLPGRVIRDVGDYDFACAPIHSPIGKLKYVLGAGKKLCPPTPDWFTGRLLGMSRKFLSKSMGTSSKERRRERHGG